MSAFKITEAPVAVPGQLVGTTEAAQTLAARHAAEQGFQHGPRSLPHGDDEDALVAGKLDGRRTTAVGQQAMQCLSLKTQAAIKGRSDIAGGDRTGKDPSG